MRKVIGFCNLHHSPQLGELTSSRPLASTSFLGRYAFIDFVLSNFSNSNIDEIGILVKDHARSLNKHLGFGNSWNINTKTGANVVMYNETNYNHPRYNHDLNNIRQNDWFLYQSKATYVVIAPVHFVMAIDYQKVIDQHIASHADITMVYSSVHNAKTDFIGCDEIRIRDGYIDYISKNKGAKEDAKISLETYVMSREMLKRILKESEKISSVFSLNDYILYMLKSLKISAYEHKGYVRCFDSMQHYLSYSLELLNYSVRQQLFLPSWPIYTVTHDTPPTKYGDKAKVSNSFIANGAIIQGEVSGSIVSRSAIISEGAKVTNSIIFTDTIITSDMQLDYCIVDKYVRIIHAQDLKGSEKNPLYIKQGDVV